MQVLLGRFRIRVGEMTRRALTAIQLSVRRRCTDDPERDGGNRNEYQISGASMSHVSVAHVGKQRWEVLTSPREKVRTRLSRIVRCMSEPLRRRIGLELHVAGLANLDQIVAGSRDGLGVHAACRVESYRAYVSHLLRVTSPAG